MSASFLAIALIPPKLHSAEVVLTNALCMSARFVSHLPLLASRRPRINVP